MACVGSEKYYLILFLQFVDAVQLKEMNYFAMLCRDISRNWPSRGCRYLEHDGHTDIPTYLKDNQMPTVLQWNFSFVFSVFGRT